MIGDNVKEIREALGLTQQKFAERIGIQQGTIASVESNKRNLSKQAQLAICREFKVNPQWLERREGEMFARRDTSIIEQLAAEYQLTPKSRELLEYFLKLPPETRELVATAVAQAATFYPRSEPAPETQKSAGKPTREEIHAMIDEELDLQEAAAKRASASSVSTHSSGARKFRNTS